MAQAAERPALSRAYGSSEPSRAQGEPWQPVCQLGGPGLIRACGQVRNAAGSYRCHMPAAARSQGSQPDGPADLAQLPASSPPKRSTVRGHRDPAALHGASARASRRPHPGSRHSSWPDTGRAWRRTAARTAACGAGRRRATTAGGWPVLPTSLSDDHSAALHEHGSAPLDDHGTECPAALADLDSPIYRSVIWRDCKRSVTACALAGARKVADRRGRSF